MKRNANIRQWGSSLGYVLAVGVLCGAGGYTINQPTANQSFGKGATITGLGTGNASEYYSLTVSSGGTIMNSKLGQVNSVGNWADSLAPPSGGWSLGPAESGSLE